MSRWSAFARLSRYVGCLAFIPGIAITAMSADIIEGDPVSYEPETAWHLAVLNGGQPRGAEVADANTADRNLFAGAKDAANLSAATIADFSSFGPAGATPLLGDFNGDGQAEFAAYLDGTWWIDLNGNRTWDSHDLWVSFGSPGDQPVVGDWDGDGKADIGVFGAAWPGDVEAAHEDVGLPDADRTPSGVVAVLRPGPLVWQLGADGALMTGPVTHTFFFGTSVDQPVAGDFNGDGIDTIGIYRQGRWVLDLDGNGRYSPVDESIRFGSPADRPLVADLNGDGVDELAVWSTDGLRIYGIDARPSHPHGAGDTLVAGDLRGHGFEEVMVIHSVQ